MKWESLLAKLKSSVKSGEVTTYRELALWLFSSPHGTQAVVAMLKAAVSDDFQNAMYTNRVIPESGKLADVNGQADQLMREGIPIFEGKVSLSKVHVVRFSS